MKPAIAVMAVAVAIIAGQIKSKGSDFYTAQGLDEGCALIVSFDGDAQKMSESDAFKMLCTVYYLTAFMDGISASVWFEQRKDASKLLEVPKDWKNKKIVASKILEFINENQEKIDPSTPAGMVLEAWYLSAHPDANEKSKTLSIAFLMVMEKAKKELEQVNNSNGK